MAYDSFHEIERMIYLLSKRLQQQLSAEEELEIQRWKAESAKNKSLFHELEHEQSVHRLVEKMQKYDVESSVSRLKHRMEAYRTKRKWSRYVLAASVMLIIGVGLFLISHDNIFYSKSVTDIPPGQHSAQLLLQDGSVVALDSMRIGETTNKAGMVITKAADGKVSCDYSKATPQVAHPAYHTICTPLGGEYQITLPDGSTVWLNANSSLKFPSQFQTGERYVELAGEGYFEITKDSNKPFIVSTNKQTIEVLGTKFNVFAYNDEVLMRTTLVEGSISVQTSADHQILKPGQEARSSRHSEHLSVVPGDIQEATAWKNGYFLFNEENIETIMQKVSRWYDVEVVYEGNVKDSLFGGTFSKNKSLQQLLKSLASTGQIRYKLTGRRVTIMSE
ncbi:FecR family protein [Olivibacter sp. SDN3]|uniref:FecR family protein n=1 Tax=Olivibacter sp. SDN3 TaxID=2764720 RepID=UPI001650D6AD|nr:FecR family protein [Olivibacter sp. SDN3]QNL48383.1 FecR family protein [Olivibacter sp. SDN3]